MALSSGFERILVSSLFGVGFLMFTSVLTRHPLVYGIDGPYYLIQVESLLSSGHLVYGDPPLAFYILAFFSTVMGDVTLGVKVGVAFFGALATIPMYLVVKSVTGRGWSAYFGVAVLLLSASLLRMMSDLIKNAIGVFFLLFFLYYLHLMTFKAATWRNAALALSFLILTAFCHILDFAVAVLFLGLYFLFSMLLCTDRLRLAKRYGLLFTSLILITVSGYLLFPFYFTHDFDKALSFLSSAVGGGSQAFSPFLPPTGQMIFMDGLLFLTAIIMGAFLAVYEMSRRNRGAAVFLSAMVIFGVLLTLPSTSQWRFWLMEFIPIASILSFVASKHGRKRDTLPFIVITLILLGGQSAQMAQMIGPSIRDDEYRELKEMKDLVPQGSFVLNRARGPLIYWVQYIFESPRVKTDSPLGQDASVFILIRKGDPHPLPRGEVVYDGRIFILIRASPPPRPTNHHPLL